MHRTLLNGPRDFVWILATTSPERVAKGSSFYLVRWTECDMWSPLPKAMRNLTRLSPLRTRCSVYAVASALVAVIDDGIYLRALMSQPPYPEPWRLAFLAVAIACFGVGALVASGIVSPWIRHGLLGASTAGLLLIGALSISSIGIPLLLAGCFSIGALFCSVRAGRKHTNIPLSALVGAATALFIVAAGLALVGLVGTTCPQGGGWVRGTLNDGPRTTTYTC